MSWFTSGLGMLNELKDQVAEAIPVDKEMIAKLTLNTDEMKAQREQFGQDETRRKKVKNMLAGMFPWETRDSERDILVEECREAILALSQDESTFFGPYEMPNLPVKTEEIEDEDSDAKEEDDDKTEEKEKVPPKKAMKDRKPSAESKEKLEKLSPLPPLLGNFDLDAHVGLIEKLLKEDPHLVNAQSKLSGGGDRETVFWRNYFFHCAYTRYEAGLSIDEIWSYSEEKAQQAEETSAEVTGEEAEETVVFEENTEDNSYSKTSVEHAFMEEPADDEPDNNSGDFDAGKQHSPNDSVLSSNGDFEVLDSDYAYEGGSGDPELDELEAEIQKELEDL
jgi:hypothetical protein